MKVHSLMVKLRSVRIGYGTNNMYEAGSMILSKNWTLIICTLIFFRKALVISTNCSSELNMRYCNPVKNTLRALLGESSAAKSGNPHSSPGMHENATGKNQPRTAPPSVASLASSASFSRPSFELRYSFLSHIHQHHSNVILN